MPSRGFDERGGLHAQREPLLSWRIPKETDRATLRCVRASTSPVGEFQKDSFMMMTDCRARSKQVKMERDARDIRQGLGKPCVCVQSCVVVRKVRSMVEVAALIVTAWLLDAHVSALLPEHSGLHAVWLERHVEHSTTYSPCNLNAATEHRAP